MSWLVVFILAGAVVPAIQGGPPIPPGERYEALRREYEAAEIAWTQRYGTGQKGDPEIQILARYRDWPAWAYGSRFLDLAEENPGDPAARDALLWAADLARQIGASDGQYQPLLQRTCRLMAREAYLKDFRLFEESRWLFRYPSPWIEELLRTAASKAPSREVRGLSCFYLGRLLELRREVAFDPWFERAGGTPFQNMIRLRTDPQFIAYVKSTDAKAVAEEARRLLRRVKDEYGDVTLSDPKPGVKGRTLRQMAERQLAELDLPDAGRPAPEITGPDLAGKPLKLSDYRGKAVALVFFTPSNERSRSSLDKLSRLAQTHLDAPFAVLGVACGEAERIAKARDSGEVRWPCWPEEGPSGPRAQAWGISDLPAIFLIGPDGVVFDRDVSEERLESDLERLLSRIGEKRPS